MIPENEKQLINALQHDDQSALQSIFTTYHVPLCRVAYKIVNDEEAAKDIVQDVFIRVWQKRNELSIQSSLEFYLKRAVVNTSINYLERAKKQVSLTIIKAESTPALNDVEQMQEYQDLSAEINKAIASLPPRTRAVFTLIRFDELSYREVADALEISTKAVEKEMMKALRMLREALKNYLVMFLIVLFQ